MRVTGLFAVPVLVGSVLWLGGCVVAIGNDSYDTGRVKLAPGELERLPVVETRADAPTVRTRHASALAELTPGTSVESFRGLFPGATFVERRQTPGDVIDAYSVRVDEVYRVRGRSYGYVSRDEKWFYFRGGQFVKFGDPGEFPQ